MKVKSTYANVAAPVTFRYGHGSMATRMNTSRTLMIPMMIFWCDSCEEAHYFVSLKEYKERMYQWWQHLDLEENKRLSGDAEDLEAWWNSLSFDQQRELYKKNY